MSIVYDRVNKENKFEMTSLPLRTVRPFIMAECELRSAGLDPTNQSAVSKYIGSRVRALAEEARQMWLREREGEDIPDDHVPKPLVRLKVEYTGFQLFHVARFGQQFIDIVANPRDTIHFYRRRVPTGTNLIIFILHIAFYIAYCILCLILLIVFDIAYYVAYCV